MFTVIIAEKEHLDAIHENHLFLEPFLKNREIAFCEWKPQETLFSEMVPSLERTVSRKETWRAIVVCTDEGLHQKNPFDLVDYTPPVREFDHAPMDEPETEEEGGEDLGELDAVPEEVGNRLNDKLIKYLGDLRAAKFAAFEEAKEKPLTRLMTFLCEQPMVSNGRNHAAEDPEFAEYVAESRKKELIRSEIIGTERVECSLPAQVFCVARRTYENPEYDIPTAWNSHEDLQYSKFYDHNLYFDRMRYFVVDLLPKHHRNYAFDYLRFLYALLILAGYDVPQGSIQKERVYALACENNEDALDKVLSEYESKLSATATELEFRIKDIERRGQDHLTDQEANVIFGSKVSIPVTIDRDIKTKDIYADFKAYRLSQNCPADENVVWKNQLAKSKKTIRLLLKQPRRAIKKASADLHELKDADVSKAMMLNEFQLEDIKERTDNEEMAMVETNPMSLTDNTEYEEKMDQHDEEIQGEIGRRMKKGTTVLLGVLGLVFYLIGFVPLFLKNYEGEKTLLGSIGLILVAFGLFFLILLIALFVYRTQMRKKVKGYNNVMQEFETELNEAFTLYSEYLSHACNVMRGYSVLNYRETTEDVGTTEARLLRKHVMDLKRTKAEVDDLFGKHISGKYDTTGADGTIYDYDYLRGVDYEYPLPYNDADRTSITYIQTGNHIELPVRFVKSLTVRREELYDD
ncbi:MAG: hypothetical protein IJ744_11840 [Lachnospiraceae bacterium]|nr:hypothetical protein [Lachnospiraceae bacterium]